MTFELVGELPGPWESDIARLTQACSTHPWGGEGPERVVVVDGVTGGFTDALERWMAPDDFKTFWGAFSKANYYFAAKTIVAVDGKVTTLMLPLPDRLMFLHQFTNQLVASSLRRRSITESVPMPTEPAAINGHALWDHYVSERARLELGRSVDIDFGSFDQTDLAPEASDVQDYLERLAVTAPVSSLPPDEGLQIWLRAVRLWAMALGPADAGSSHYALEIEAFATQPFAVATKDAWNQSAEALREIWSRPDQSLAGIDAIAGKNVWLPLETALVVLWKEITVDD